MLQTKICNIFSTFPSSRKREVFQVLHKSKHIRIERIVSHGQATPPGKWLRENRTEWVMVVRGRAKLLFKGAKKSFSLKAGDYLFIPKNIAHRVEWTDPKQRTIWLVVHIV
jgi:cupin 2 domain-containing protein